MALAKSKGIQWPTLDAPAIPQHPRSGASMGSAYAWPDGCGGASTLRVANVLSAAYGTAEYVAQMRAYGNAIVAPVAIEFIRAVMACRP